MTRQLSNLSKKAVEEFKKYPAYYILCTMLARNNKGKRIFSPLEEDIIVNEYFNNGEVSKSVLRENHLTLQSYLVKKEKVFKKLKRNLIDILRKDFNNTLSKREICNFWGDNSFPLKDDLEKIFIKTKIVQKSQSIQEGKQVQQSAKRRGMPWLFLQKEKPVKYSNTMGVYKNADDKMKEIIKKIEKNKREEEIISIMCDKSMAGKILSFLKGKI